MGRRWGVYTARSRHGHLLYVGKGHDGAQDRLRKHRLKRWGKYIHSFDFRVVDPNTEAEAFRVERETIAAEKPLFNKMLNGRLGYRALRRLEELEAARPPRERSASRVVGWLEAWWGPVAAAAVVLIWFKLT